MKIKKMFPTTLMLTLMALGCSEGSHTAAEHSGHKNEGQAAPRKTAEVFENGRIIKYENEAPEIDLIDQDGNRVTNEDLKGKVVLINFIYANCKETCPMMVHKFMDIIKEMPEEMGKSLRLLSITMDPERDSAEALKKFSGELHADTSYWSFLTGDKEIVDKVLKGFNFFYKKNEDGESFAHANKIVLLDKKGVWKYDFNVLTVPVDIAIERIKEEV